MSIKHILKNSSLLCLVQAVWRMTALLIYGKCCVSLWEDYVKIAVNLKSSTVQYMLRERLM